MASLPTTYDEPIRIAVIGGTGLSSLPASIFTPKAVLDPQTPWGKASSPITVLEHAGSISASGKATPIAFLARHGVHHEIAPHEVNSRANVAALRSLGVRTVVAFSAVGSLKLAIKPRDFVIADQVIDRTKGVRPFTFFDRGVVGHVPFADPFDEPLAALLRKCGAAFDWNAGDATGKGGEDGEVMVLHERGTLVCMEGPQFSTRAESKMYRSWGGDVINMSVLPEAKLAREAEMAYAMVCMSTDYDCWHETNESVTVEMVMGNMKANSRNAKRFLEVVVDTLSEALNSGEGAAVVMAKGWEGLVKGCLSTSVEGRAGPGWDGVKWLFPGYFE